MPTDMPADIPTDAPVVLGQAPFAVHLDVFEGPFDLLLGLISKHKLDVTEVALSQVTDEFITFIRATGGSWDLGEATQFLLIAATLLDLKAARLLPSGAVEDEEDLALLEARDLLFARLLQYRAYKEAAAFFATRIGAESRRFARDVSLEPSFAAAIPEVLLGIGPDEFAMLAAAALRPRIAELVSVEHIHSPLVSVREQAILLAAWLRTAQTATFRSLVADCSDTVSVVARFLALLELYRDGQVAFEQVIALGDLQIRWTGGGDVDVTHFEEYEATESADESSSDDAE